MNDPYRITDVPHPAAPSPRDRDRLSGLLWVALAVLVALNAASSVVHPDNLLPSLAFGLGAVVCVGVLVVRYLGRRQR